MKTTYLYILYSPGHDKYYVGVSEDYTARLLQHNSNEGNRYTKPYRPWVLRAAFSVPEGMGMARKIEVFIKKQKSKKFIATLCNPDTELHGLLAQLVRVP